MRALMAIGLVLALPTSALAAPPLTIAEFVQRAEPLMKKSMASLVFSAEARKLMKEFGAAAEAVRTRQEADLAAGRKPATCLPPKGKAKVDARELIAHLRAIPAAEQQHSFQSGFAGFVARKYPCPAR